MTDLTSDLVDLTTMPLRELRSAQTPALLEAVQRTIDSVISVTVDEETQGQVNGER